MKNLPANDEKSLPKALGDMAGRLRKEMLTERYNIKEYIRLN